MGSVWQAALGKSAETLFISPDKFFSGPLQLTLNRAIELVPLRARSRTKFLESELERNETEWVVPKMQGWSLARAQLARSSDEGFEWKPRT